MTMPDVKSAAVLRGMAMLCGFAVMTPVLAAPPAPNRIAAVASTSPSYAGPLDLRPPAPREWTLSSPSNSRIELRPGEPLLARADDERWDRTSTADPSPLQALLRRSRREGLPLARLWQQGHATLSVGLNPKGKPGLWLVGRTH